MVALLAAPTALAGPDDDDDDDGEAAAELRIAAEPIVEAPAPAVYDFADDLVPETVAVSPGGARDIDLVRAAIESGGVPTAQQITAEGLFAEHDLPLRVSGRCEQTLCLRLETIAATLIAAPAVHYLAQIGFASDLDLTSFRRPRLNLVIVMDHSSSMAGNPIETARAAAIALVDQLGPGDQASLVSFGAAPQVLVRGVATPDSSLTSSLASITPAGATGLERGLYTGFEVARRTSVGFPGTTRVVLITDDRPTVGQTAPGAFFSLVSAAASRGVGLTTLGVGPQFAAPLAYKLSSVRGGNVLYLRSPEHARERIAGELDTLVTELAHALVIELDPAPGMRVTDVYGVPGELLVREGDRVSLRVETIFLSKRRGAIYLALAPKGRANLPREPVRTGARLGEVRLRYRALDQTLRSDRAALVNIAPRRASPGLTRGALLVDQLTSMRAASERYYGAPDVPADRRAAYEQLRALADRYRAVVDPALAAQRELVLRLEETLAASAGVRSSP